MAAQITDKFLHIGEDDQGNKVFTLIVSAFNQILKLSQAQGLNCKYQVMEVCTRVWLVWSSYQSVHDPKLLADLEACAKDLMTLIALSKF